MDPNVTYEEMMDAIREGDVEKAQEFAGYLAAWIAKKGCLPKEMQPEVLDI